jgi:hypothetical protein
LTIQKEATAARAACNEQGQAAKTINVLPFQAGGLDFTSAVGIPWAGARAREPARV